MRGFCLTVLTFLLLTPLSAPAQVKLPPIKPRVDVLKPSPAMRQAVDSQQPFIAQYAFCNAMQLYQYRRVIWEPVYRELGASDKELEDYSANLVGFIKEFCGNRPQTYWQSALDRVNAFDAATDDRTAKNLHIPVPDATAYRIWRLLSNVEAFQRECLGGEESALAEDLSTIGGSLLPSTQAPPGLSLERKDLSTTLGRCGSTSKGGAPRSYKPDQASLSACIANAVAQEATCDNPAGQGPSGNVVRREDLGGGCFTQGTAQTCYRTERALFSGGGYVDTHIQTRTWEDRAGRHTSQRTEWRTYGTENELISTHTVATQDGQAFLVRDTGRVEDTGWVKASVEGAALPLTLPAGYRAVTSSFVSPGLNPASSFEITSIEPIGTPSGTRDSRGRRECLSVNPASSQPLGLSRVAADAAGGSSPVHAGRLNAFDLIGQCVCTSLGRIGPELAAATGLHCGPDENSRRLDCLQNPKGPADGIRPECVRYLQADNPGRDTRTAITEWCSQVVQCPAGAAVAEMNASGGVNCSCGGSRVSFGGSRGEGGGVTGGVCSRVSCASGPGGVGMDLFRQCCSGSGPMPGIGQPQPPPARPPLPAPPVQKK